MRVKKELEEGFEILEMACPCAVTVTKPDYEPRFPTIKSKMAANKAKIPVLSAADCRPGRGEIRPEGFSHQG